MQSYKELLYGPFYTAENNGERNELLNKWKQAGQVLNIIQFKIPTSFTFSIHIIFEADFFKANLLSSAMIEGHPNLETRATAFINHNEIIFVKMIDAGTFFYWNSGE